MNFLKTKSMAQFEENLEQKNKYCLEYETNSVDYYPIFRAWKWAIPSLIGLFLVAGIVTIYCTFQHFTQYNSSYGILYIMTLHAITAISVFICLCIGILKLINVYAQNMEKEREILADLYAEEQKRLIIRKDNAKDSKKENKKDVMTEEDKLILKNAKAEKAYFEKEIEYLKEINKQLTEKPFIIK